MPDTGKMKRLFQKCTTNLLHGNEETMVYPDHDLDGIAEQISLYVEGMESEAQQQDQIAGDAERKAGEAIGSMRRAHKTLTDGLVSVPNPNQCRTPIDDEEEDEDNPDFPETVSPSKKRSSLKPRF